MIPILAISSRAFNPFIAHGMTVGALYEQASAAGSDLFVLHDTRSLVSAVVIPEQATRLIIDLELDHDDSASSTGLLDLLRRDQITVRQDRPASQVVRLAQRCHVPVIIVVDNERLPAGLFAPGYLSRLLSHTQDIAPEMEPLRQMSRSTGPAESGSLSNLVAGLEQMGVRSVGHILRQLGVRSYVCQGTGQDHHFWHRCPCDIHPRANCRQRSIV